MTEPVIPVIRPEIRLLISNELAMASDKYPPFKSDHEGYAVILEELDEMWDAIKGNDASGARAEAVQVAAMAIRFIQDSMARARR